MKSSTNPITGDKIQTKIDNNQAYAKGWDLIFSGGSSEVEPLASNQKVEGSIPSPRSKESDNGK